MGWWPRKGETRAPAAAMLAALLCCARAPGDTRFVESSYAIVTPHLQAVGQLCTGSTPVNFTHDSQCTLTISTPGPGGEVLTLNGQQGGPTLDTSYMLTGFTGADANWVGSAAFLNRSYTFPGGNTEHMTLRVQGAAPSDRAPEPGPYQSTLVLTITF